MSITIAVYGNRRQAPHISSIIRLIGELRAHGARIVMHEKLHGYLSTIAEVTEALGPRFADEVATQEQMPEAAIVLSIGGDGTFLNTARWVGARQIPIMGVNTGHLGYLSACSIEDSICHVPSIVAGRYSVEDRAMLWVQTSEGSIDWPYALNEAAILKKDTSAMLNVDTRVNGSPLAVYRADGLIISTPTGSTAYNLSVGGPILQPSTPAFAIAPVAPHSLTMRPVVLDDRSTISMVTDTRADSYLLSLDGRGYVMPADSHVTVHRAPFVTRVAHLDNDYTFVKTLRNKLHWGS